MSAGKTGCAPADLAPILVRLGIDPEHWTALSSRIDELFRRVAGSRPTLTAAAANKGRRWYQAPGGHLLTVA